jgi:ParB-like chromosome segregation protein Spo0J
MDIKKLKLNKANPRIIKDWKFKGLLKSLQEFPKMLKLRPIVYDPVTFEVLGGNMRLRALLELGYKEIPDDWIKSASELTDEEKRRFIIEDNVEFGEWNFDILANEWDETELKDWGVEIPVFENEEKELTDLSNKIEICFKLEIEMNCESEQQILFERLTNEGYKCRILTL